jgi:GNAT superfamily N-acetyltransferase
MLEVRAYTVADQTACLSLLRRAHDPEFSEDRFTWLHEHCPHGRSLRTVCCDGERVVGFYAAIPKRVVVGNRILIAGRDVDPVVDPQYRRRGVFGQLLDYALHTFNGIDFFFNFANDVSRPGFLSRGWRLSGALLDAVCQLSSRRWLDSESLLFLATGARARSARNAFVVRTDPATLLGKHGLRPVAPEGMMWVQRTPAYLEWRYVRAPLRSYECFALLRGSEAVLALITRLEATSRRLLVLDILTSGSAPYDLGPLLVAMRSAHPGARAVMWNSTPAWARRLFVCNPLHRNRGYPMLVRAGTSGVLPGGPAGLHRAFVTHGDMEYL